MLRYCCRGYKVRTIRAGIVEGHILPHFQRLFQWQTIFSCLLENVFTFFHDVPSFIPCQDHSLQSNPIGRGSCRNALRVPNGTTTELENAIFAQQV